MQSGEVWYEVAGELAQEGLRPVTPDQECLTEIWQTHEEKAEETLKKQVFHDNSYSRLINQSLCIIFQSMNSLRNSINVIKMKN